LFISRERIETRTENIQFVHRLSNSV